MYRLVDVSGIAVDGHHDMPIENKTKKREHPQTQEHKTILRNPIEKQKREHAQAPGTCF